ncbi:PadR family transcriptional regulator [Anaerocolumna sp. MB42-C2]|uniref:PadR family transcriptional regulator n=1 Tax=Anaerocolumna sp. MB42-C2 TaxID=3070997 RepID=UPI0027E1B930|nr:PadR family transcriptional regulator [Anaerocolumna sp. MB42-C2]WMJ89110.1 PadR family transcriptional regulator [Anaerocolumna sp. MB42-C2]
MMKNKSRYAILGILNISPSTGYDIKKYCDTVISGIWHENFGHIYPTLKVLEQEGCIRQLSEDKESRKIKYEITNEGREELFGWLSEDTLIQPVRSEFMLKFLFSSQLPPENVIEMLNQYKQRMEDELNKYIGYEHELLQGIPDISAERARFLKATLRRGILTSKASIEWCQETISELKY